MAAYSAKNNDNTMGEIRAQSTKSRLKTRNLNRPVTSTLDPKDHYKRPQPVQGLGIKGNIMEGGGPSQRELEDEVKRLKEKLSAAEQNIKRLMKRDKEMTER